uniref:C-type lectin domain-containing protein n=1 Tax=Gopherus evgoodei TaxID=1825980 RepID=A0A8C4YB73_9SAUR
MLSKSLPSKNVVETATFSPDISALTKQHISTKLQMFLPHGEDCYFLSIKWKTWQESKALCSSLDSRFLKIESKEELGFIIRSAQSYSSYSLWIALSRKGADGSWLWEDGRLTYLNALLVKVQRGGTGWAYIMLISDFYHMKLAAAGYKL